MYLGDSAPEATLADEKSLITILVHKVYCIILVLYFPNLNGGLVPIFSLEIFILVMCFDKLQEFKMLLSVLEI